MKIKQKLTTIFLLLLIIPAIFIGMLIFANVKDSLVTSRLKELATIADLKADKLARYYEDLTDNLRIAQGYYNIKTNLPLVIKYSKDRTNPRYIAAKKMLDAQLSVWTKVKEEINDLFLLGPDGKIVYEVNQARRMSRIGQPLPGTGGKTFEEGKRKLIIGDIFMMQDASPDFNYAQLIAVPIYGYDSKFAGEAVIEINMDKVYAFLKDKTGLGQSGETLIVKKIEGRAGNLESVGSKSPYVLFMNPLRFDPLVALNKTVFTGEKKALPAQKAANGENGAGISKDYRGKEVLAAWRYIPSLGWGLVTKIDMADVLAQADNLRNVILIICLIVVAIVCIFSFVILDTISKPIELLQKGTEMIGQGNLDYKVGTDEPDEIGQLSRSFDAMVGKLKSTMASRDELNEEVNRRKKAEEELKAISKMKSEFVATVSHELRTPLTVIKEGASLINGRVYGELSEKQGNIMDMVADNITNLEKLINDLLDMSRIESKQLEITPVEFDICEAMEKLVEQLKINAREKKIAIIADCRFSGGPPAGRGGNKIFADADKFRQIVTNLVANAINYNKEGGEIRISEADEGEFFRIEIADTGVGIKEEDMPKLFERFMQFNRVPGSGPKGTGLGLAITKALVELHGGRIWAESKYGQGSKFVFTFPKHYSKLNNGDSRNGKNEKNTYS